MNAFLQELECIRRNNEPVVVYGNAELANRIHNVLHSLGIEVHAIAVDGAFVKDSAEEKRLVVDINQCIHSTDKFSYIVAFNPRHNIDQVQEKLSKNAIRILMYDFGYGTHDDILYDIAYYNAYTSCYKDQIDEIYSWLADDYSRQTLAAYLQQKQTGLFGTYAQFKAQHQYFPDDIITLKPGSVFVDCGAFTGDSISAFLAKLGRDAITGYDTIYAFEPTTASFQKLLENTQDMARCFCFQKGVWDCDQTFSFNECAQYSTITDQGDQRIRVTSIDATLAGAPATFIKMDIEGAELKALHGAEQTIRRFKPVLAICIYHKPEDLVTIPRYIKKLHQDYRLFVRAHPYQIVNANELVLYAVP